MNKIVADIKISDILALLEGRTTDYYICHNICWLLVAQFRQIDGYVKYEKDYFTRSQFAGNSSLPYYFYYNSYGDSFPITEQVFQYLDIWMKKIIPNVAYPHSRFYFTFEGEHALYDLNRNISDPLHDVDYTEHFERQFRINLLTEILKMDINATIHVDLELFN